MSASASGMMGGGNGFAGGLIGQANQMTITGSYSTNSGTSSGMGFGSGYAGGLVAVVNNGSVTRSYATGNLNGSASGGLVGLASGATLTANFHDTTTGRANGSAGGSIAGVTGKTTAQMQQYATYDDSGWDIVYGWETFNPNAGKVWGICSGSTRAYLLWERSSSPCSTPGASAITGVTPAMTSADVAYTADDSGGSSLLRVEFALDDTLAVDDSTTNLAGPYTLGNLNPGTAYQLFMRSVNGLGPGPWTAATSFATSAPPVPPTPPAPIPASAPSDVTATPLDGAVATSWLAPESTGSYPVSTYRATATPGGLSCLTTSTSCTIEGLTNGTTYTVTVQALTGAGWSPSSTPSAAVTPQSRVSKSLVITGSRGKGNDLAIIRVRGTSQGLEGATVTMWLTFGPSTPTPAARTTTITDDGTFAWSRRSNRTVTVYAEAGGVRSNSITLRAR